MSQKGATGRQCSPAQQLRAGVAAQILETIATPVEMGDRNALLKAATTCAPALSPVQLNPHLHMHAALQHRASHCSPGAGHTVATQAADRILFMHCRAFVPLCQCTWAALWVQAAEGSSPHSCSALWSAVLGCLSSCMAAGR